MPGGGFRKAVFYKFLNRSKNGMTQNQFVHFGVFREESVKIHPVLAASSKALLQFDFSSSPVFGPSSVFKLGIRHCQQPCVSWTVVPIGSTELTEKKQRLHVPRFIGVDDPNIFDGVLSIRALFGRHMQVARTF